MKYIYRTVFLILITVFAVSLVAPAAAQCQVRTDWGIYVVQRGDSLSRIARANNISLDELIRANCLSSTTIFAGQQLRVPGAAQPGPTAGVQNPNGTYFTPATYRTFENGFMIWASNNGTIYVFGNNGRVSSYALSRYGNLPIPDVSTEVPPAGRYAPTFGMARVWYNFPEVRALLGWSLQPGEGRYDVYFQQPSFGNFFNMTLWDNRFLRVNLDGTWSGIDVTPTATSTSQPGVSTGATFQAFENGFMVWRADNGEIRVYIGGDSGELTIYNNAQYAALPLIRGFTAPPGRFVPDGGFGRVWRNFENIRSRIGYAIGSEQGYTMALVITGNNIVGFSLPDRRFVYGSGSQWHVAPDYYPPTPVNTFTPSPTGPTPTPTTTLTPSPTYTVSPTATLTGSEPQIGTTFQLFEGGFMIWRADTSDIWVFFNLGGEAGEIAVIPNIIYGLLPINRTLTPLPGRLRPDNGFGRVWSNFAEVRQRLGWAVNSEWGYLMTARLLPNGDTWSFSLPDGRLVTQTSGQIWTLPGGAAATLTPTATATPSGPVTIAATGSFQWFDGGFMLWRGDIGDIYAYIGAATGEMLRYPVSSYGALPEVYPGTPPPGHRFPILGFNKVWNAFGLHDRIGFPYTQELGHQMMITIMPDGTPIAFTIPGGGHVTRQSNGTWALDIAFPTPFPYETLTAQPVQPSLTVEPATATAEAPTATPEAPTATPEAPTATVETAPATVGASLQCFQNGYMIWRSDTDQIFVLFGRDGGSAVHFVKTDYDALPEATGTPPDPSLVLPILGFGKVWANNQIVRDGLGWATNDEEYYDAVLSEPGLGVLRIGIPGGGAVDVIAASGNWSFPSLGNTLTCP